VREDAVDDAVTALGVREAGPGRPWRVRTPRERQRTLEDRYFKDVQYGGTQSAEEKISVGKGAEAQLLVTISSRRARVQGAVIDEDGLSFADKGETVELQDEVKLLPELTRHAGATVGLMAAMARR
jgi:hypothetical protein